MNLLLICETPIIVHIFTLISKRIKIDLTIQNNYNITSKYDLIIIDQNFIDNKFNEIKKFSILIGAISSEELPINKLRDFIIPRPFLPSKLETILIEQIKYIKEDLIQGQVQEKEIDYNYVLQHDSDIVMPVIDYLENELDENIDPSKFTLNDYFDEKNANDEEEDENYSENLDDESIVSMTNLNMGGVLDSIELNKINNILQENETLENQDWQDIGSIIDDALDNVKDYSINANKENKTYNLVLNEYGIDELKPLLEKFDQTTIDKIAKGYTIDLKVSLKDK